jgi:hypothetical protein
MQSQVALVELKYTIQRSTEVEKFLGLKIEHFSKGSIKLIQTQRIEDMMKQYHLVEIPFPSIPVPSTFSDVDQDNAPACDYGMFMFC